MSSQTQDLCLTIAPGSANQTDSSRGPAVNRREFLAGLGCAIFMPLLGGETAATPVTARAASGADDAIRARMNPCVQFDPAAAFDLARASRSELSAAAQMARVASGRFPLPAELPPALRFHPVAAFDHAAHAEDACASDA